MKEFFVCLLVIFIALVVASWGYGIGKESKETEPDRARFMLECTYDWSLSPSACRDILDGKDPPVNPEYAGC